MGSQYHACKNYRDALNTYLLIVKNKMFSTAGKSQPWSNLKHKYSGT